VLSLVLYNVYSQWQSDLQTKKDLVTAPQIKLATQLSGKKYTLESSDTRVTVSYAYFQTVYEQKIRQDEANYTEDKAQLAQYQKELETKDEVVRKTDNPFIYDINILADLIEQGKAMVFDKSTNNYVEWIKIIGWSNMAALSGGAGRDFYLPSGKCFLSTMDAIS